VGRNALPAAGFMWMPMISTKRSIHGLQNSAAGHNKIAIERSDNIVSL